MRHVPPSPPPPRYRAGRVAVVALAVLLCTPDGLAGDADDPDEDFLEFLEEEEDEEAARPTNAEIQRSIGLAPSLRPPPQLETLPGMYPQATSLLATQGISVATPDRRYTMRIGGFFHLDTRFASSDDDAYQRSDVFFRRLRLTFDGRLFGDFEYRLLWDFMIEPWRPYDFHVDWRPRPEVNIRLGGFKSPFSLDRRGRAYALPLMERAWPNSLSPNRDIGAFVYGQSRDGFFSYDVAVVTGAHDLNVRYDFRGSPDFAGRVYFQPFRLGGPPELKHLGLGFSWTLGQELGSPSDPRLGNIRSSARRMLFSYVGGEEGAYAHGRRDRQALQGHWRHRRFNTLVEVTRSAGHIGQGQLSEAGPAQRAYLANYAWQALFSMTMNPDDENRWFGVSPSRPLAPTKGQWGGFTWSVRYQELYIDRGAFPVFADPTVSAHTARGFGASLQWHINTNLETQVDLERVLLWGEGLGGTGRMPGETALMTRVEMRY